MTPDWPNLPNYHSFTPEQHEAHTTKKGIHRPEDLLPGTESVKFSKQILKAVRKPHVLTKRTVPKRTPRKKRKL